MCGPTKSEMEARVRADISRIIPAIKDPSREWMILDVRDSLVKLAVDEAGSKFEGGAKDLVCIPVKRIYHWLMVLES